MKSSTGRNAYDQIVGILMLTFAMCLMSTAIGFARSDLKALTQRPTEQVQRVEAKPKTPEEERAEQSVRLLVSAYFYLSFFAIFAGIAVMFALKWGFWFGAVVGVVGLAIGILGGSVTGGGGQIGTIAFALSGAYCTARALGRLQPAP